MSQQLLSTEKLTNGGSDAQTSIGVNSTTRSGNTINSGEVSTQATPAYAETGSTGETAASSSTAKRHAGVAVVFTVKIRSGLYNSGSANPPL